MNSRRVLHGLILLQAMCVTSWASNTGASLYKKKCAGCHGASGEGKSAPALKGTSADVNQIADRITKGDPASKGPHKKAMHGVNQAHATAIAEYVKTLQ